VVELGKMKLIPAPLRGAVMELLRQEVAVPGEVVERRINARLEKAARAKLLLDQVLLDPAGSPGRRGEITKALAWRGSPPVSDLSGIDLVVAGGTGPGVASPLWAASKARGQP
jgi:hypothetical protein